MDSTVEERPEKFSFLFSWILLDSISSYSSIAPAFVLSFSIGTMATFLYARTQFLAITSFLCLSHQRAWCACYLKQRCSASPATKRKYQISFSALRAAPRIYLLFWSTHVALAHRRRHQTYWIIAIRTTISIDTECVKSIPNGVFGQFIFEVYINIVYMKISTNFRCMLLRQKAIRMSGMMEKEAREDAQSASLLIR